jgi:hypothetical protein
MAVIRGCNQVAEYSASLIEVRVKCSYRKVNLCKSDIPRCCIKGSFVIIDFLC